MAVRFRKVLQRRSIEEKRFQHALVDNRDALRLHSLIVMHVVPHQLDFSTVLMVGSNATLRKSGSTGWPTRLVVSARRRHYAVDCLRRDARRFRERRRRPHAPKESRVRKMDRRPARCGAGRAARSSRAHRPEAAPRPAVRRATWRSSSYRAEAPPSSAFVTPWMKIRAPMSPVTICEPSLLT